jgi:inositol-phosphate phosphatase / L-galactose 1-phosphate phosphatase / histidinol-phosphatase
MTTTTTTAPDLAPLVAFAEQLADEAAAMIVAHTAQTAPLGTSMGTRIKPDKTFVTALDLAIEARLRERISAAYTAHGIYGEEFDPVATDAEWVWTLDPIDGTMALVTGMPVYSTLIALLHHGVPVVGVMHFPATRQRWVGAKGQATVCRDVSGGTASACHTRSGATLHDAIQSASSPDFFKQPGEQRALAAVTAQTAWRIYGGAALSYGRLASGSIDVAIDAGLKLYDYAPFVPIVEGAGGIVTDWAGHPLNLHSGTQVLAAGDARRHAAALALIAAELT